MTKKQQKIFTPEQIKEANQVDMVSFLQSHGKGEIIGGGRYPKYKINGHDSIVIDTRKNTFYHNALGRGDNLVGLLKDYEGYTFRDAVATLLGEELDKHTGTRYEQETEEPYQYQYEVDRDSMTQVKNYLINERQIDPEIITYLIDNDYLVQDKKYRSAILHWKKKGLGQEEIIGATSILTGPREPDKPSKYIMRTSEKHYGFNVTLGQPKALYFFEAGIDLLSYWSLHKDLKDVRLVCLEGLKPQTILTFVQDGIKEFQQFPVNGIYYGLDNDVAGQRLFSKVHEQMNFKTGLSSEGTIPNHALIIDNHAIPQNMFDTIQAVSKEKEVEWPLLASIFKLENNYTTGNRCANVWQAYGFFADADYEEERVIDERAALESLATTITEKGLTIETLVDVYDAKETPLKEHEKQAIQSYCETYYAQLSEGNYQVKETVLKDWNEQLVFENTQEVDRTLTPLAILNEKNNDRISKDYQESFRYYLQDAPTWDKAKERLTDSYHVSPQLVDALMKKRLIRQDDNHRIVYLWAEKGNVLGGQYTGTIEDKSFGKEKVDKGILNLSTEGYGFNFTIGQAKSIHFFQSPEDLLAYWSLKQGTLTDTTLFSLSDDSPQSMINIINERLSEGVPLERVHVAINHTKSGVSLLDGISQLEAFQRQDKSLLSHAGIRLPIMSERPLYGRTWSEENIKKKERLSFRQEYQRLYGKSFEHTATTQQQQTMTMSR